MKKSKMLCVVLLAIVCVIAQMSTVAFAAETVNQNQIISPGFDSWGTWGTTSISLGVGIDHAGLDYMGRTEFSSGLVVPLGSGTWQWTELKPNTKYVFTAQVRAADEFSTGIMTTQESGLETEPTAAIEGIEWQEYRLEFTAGAESGGISSQVKFIADEGNGIIVDDVSLVEDGTEVNQIINPGFDAWGTWGTTSISLGVGIDHGGLDFMGRTEFSSGLVIPLGSGTWQWTELKPNTTYVFTAQAKAADEFSTGIMTTQASGLETEPTAAIEGIEFQEYKLEFTTGAEAGGIFSQVKFIADEGNGIIVDDVSLVDMTPVEEPVDEEPVEEPVDEEPVEEPVDEEPVEEPVDEEPVEEPVDEEPVEEPVDEEPVVEEPIEEEPVETNPETGDTSVWMYALVSLAAMSIVVVTGKKMYSQEN